MKIEDVEKKIKNLERNLKTRLPPYIKSIVAHDAVAMISDRVITKQRKAKGGQFSSYSTKPMLTSGHTDKSSRVWRAMASSKAKRKQLDWVTIKAGGVRDVHLFELKGGYAQLRRLEGFSNRSKSFEFTGEMWRTFGLKRTKQGKGELTMVLGGKNQASQKKMDMNSKREGVNIVDISQRELDKLALLIEKEMQKYINQQGLR